MQKTILAVYGIADKGKSSALRAICSKMIAEEAKVVQFCGQHGQLALDDLTNFKVMGDIEACLIYKGIKVGIYSWGDPGWSEKIKEHIISFQKKNCELILCATRTRGATKRAVKENAGDYQIQWFSKLKGNYIDIDLLWDEVQRIIQ